MTNNSALSSPLLSPHSAAELRTPNRVAMAPMTRLRADTNGVPQDIMATYYSQRASAGLIVTEGIAPSVRGQQYLTEPGLFTEEQVAGWSRVLAAVREAPTSSGGPVFAQIMHAGRNGHPANRLDGGVPESPSPVPQTVPLHTLDGKVTPVTPRAMTTDDIASTLAEYQQAARNAIRAGFDGVEIHGANSYLPHQFLADKTNQRTDRYGRTPRDRARFVIEVTEAVAEAVGAHRTGLRLSPGNTQFEMSESDPEPAYRAVLDALDPLGLAYLHLTDDPHYPALDDLRPRWSTTLVGNTGEHPRETSQESAQRLLREKGADLVSFGRPYISNPDLVERIRTGTPWTAIREKNYHYTSGTRGYIDYPAVTVAPAS